METCMHFWFKKSMKLARISKNNAHFKKILSDFRSLSSESVRLIVTCIHIVLDGHGSRIISV
jgi:hypothetical protein